MIALVFIYCAVFCILVIIQFSSSGNFVLEKGDMTIRGRYIKDSLSASQIEYLSGEFPKSEAKPVAGGIRIFYAGLEFDLIEEREKGFILRDSDGNEIPANPEVMITEDNIVRFILPTGTIITFNSNETPRGPQLQISAVFADNVTEAVIPVVPRRSSLVNDSGQITIIYSGLRYVLSSHGHELEDGFITLSGANPSVSYFSRSRQSIFDPSDYITAREHDYDNAMRNWQESIFTRFNQNSAALQSEDDVVAFLSQSLTRTGYNAAVSSVPASFTNSSMHSFRSSAYIGGMANAYSLFVASENEKQNLITRLVAQRSLDFLDVDHILDYLFSRNSIVLANDVMGILGGVTGEMIAVNNVPGLLEYYQDMKKWRPESGNPIDRLTEHMLYLVSENLSRDTEKDTVFARNSNGVNIEFSMRLGLALVYWAEAEGNSEWASIGRSLVLSAIQEGNDSRLNNILKPTIYFPRAELLSNEGHWAWTVAQSINVTTVSGDLNLAFTFPVNMTHHVIVRGVSPFLSLQFNGQTWRTDSQFERYDSFGWVYYAEEQILVLKLRHNTAVINVRLVYRAVTPAPAPAPTPAPAPAPAPAAEAVTPEPDVSEPNY